MKKYEKDQLIYHANYLSREITEVKKEITLLEDKRDKLTFLKNNIMHQLDEATETYESKTGQGFNL